VDGNHNYIWSNEYNVFVASSLHEEGENLEIIDASTFQMNGKTVKITLWSYENELFDELLRLSVYVDGKLTNLSGIVVNSGLHGQTSPGNIYQYSVHQYFSVSGNVLTIKPNGSSYGETASYTFDDASGQFVTAGGAQTTTTTTENTTTTTTTVDPAETEEALRKIFEEYVAEKQKEISYPISIDAFYYDAAAKKAYGIYTCEDCSYPDVLCVITKDGVVEQSDVTYKKDAHRFEEAICFTCNGSTFIAAIVNLSSNGGNLYALNIYNVSGNEPLRTNLYTIYVGNVISPYGYLITDPNSSIALDDYFTVKSDSVITVNGVDYTYDTASAQFVKVGDSDSGKTDNGSASNAPASTATKNTSGTPKTGDTTTVPAVAVGLTLTAAGVVAFISKRKK
ncbi:MAG: LPXTG cell wall anchor domain-containing protein, partial [Ruminococcus sp.]|nr:LPXTG cell wall anchor domain-containing protein [Ruminococcus sp.]